MPEYVYQDFELISVYEQLLNLRGTDIGNFKDQQLVLMAYRELIKSKYSEDNPVIRIIDQSIECYGDSAKVGRLRELLESVERGETPCIIGDLHSEAHAFGFIAERGRLRVINKGERGDHATEETYELDVERLSTIVECMYVGGLPIAQIYQMLGTPLAGEDRGDQKVANCYINSVVNSLNKCLRDNGIHIPAIERKELLLNGICKVVENQRGLEAAERIRKKLKKIYHEYVEAKKAPNGNVAYKYKRRRKSDIYYMSGDTWDGRDQIWAYKEAIKIDPNNAAAHQAFGIALIGRHFLAGARKRLEKAIRINPYLSAAYVNLGTAFIMQGKYSDAMQALDKAIKINPYDTEAYFKMGIAFEKQDRWEDAKKKYQEVLKINPYCMKALQQLALVFENTDMTSGALSCYERIAQLPDSRDFA